MRPTSFKIDTTLYWVLRLYNSSGILVDADSTPSVAVRKNGSSVGDSVTVTKRTSTTGIYDCSYDPAGESEGDQFTIEETAVISSITYQNAFTAKVDAAERGTDSAYTGTPPTAAAIRSEIDSNSTQLAILSNETYGNAALNTDLDTLLTRIVGTIASGTHNPQSGDSYTVVNHGTYGNSAIYTSISTILNRIGNFAGSGVNTILGFFKALMKKDASVPSDLGGTYASSTDANEALSESIAAIDVGSGSGARTVVITINDGTNTLGHCKVRATNGAESYVVSTESDGTATFHLDDATWSIAVTKYGYTLATQSLIVTSNTSITYSMTQVAVTTPSAPNLSTGTLLCLGTDGLPEANVVISFRLTRGPGDTGYALDAEHFTATSDTDGNIEAAFIREATYDGKRGKGDWVSFTVGDVSSFNLPEILGRN